MSEFKNKLTEVCGGTLREIKDAAIPEMIHRIWVGGAIEPATLDNLIQFQNRLNAVQNGRTQKYRHILWTTESTGQNTEAAGQMERLRLSGMEIKKIDDMPDASNFDADVKKEVNRLMQKRSYKFVSDLWRMYVLYVMGGIYMDADIGIGQETFEDTLYHRYQFKNDQYSYMPLLGSASPFNDISKGVKIQDYLEQEKRLYRGGYPWNYFYAANKENNVILKMLLALLYENTDAQTAANEMIESFYEDVGEKADNLFIHAFAPLYLQYATRASTDKQQ